MMESKNSNNPKKRLKILDQILYKKMQSKHHDVVLDDQKKSAHFFKLFTKACTKEVCDHVYVTSCSLSSDNRLLLTGSNEGTLKLWDVESGKCIRRFDWHDSDITSCSFSPDETLIVSGESTGHFVVWNVESGKYITHFYIRNKFSEHRYIWNANIKSCSISSNNKMVLVCSDKGTINIWDLESKICVNTFQGKYGFTSCSFFSDDKMVLSSSGDGAIKIWDVETGKCINTFNGHTSAVTSCSFSSDNKKIVSSSMDETIRVWDLESGKCIKILKGHTHTIQSCSFASNNQLIISCTMCKTSVWDLESGKCIKVFKNNTNNYHWFSCSTNGQVIVNGMLINANKVIDI